MRGFCLLKQIGAKKPSKLPRSSMDALQAVKQTLELTALDSFFVKHCSSAFGLKLEAENWKASTTLGRMRDRCYINKSYQVKDFLCFSLLLC